jgi:RNA polymerase sigma factor (sigma-70 family)
MQEDAELLCRYANEKSEEAFAELVRRHLNLVYSVALRQVAGDAHLAEDVAQQVFTALARKAASLAGRPALSGWLYRSAHFAASDVVRVERRRRAREQEVHAMNSLMTDPTPPADWDKVRPVLDAAIAELDERDRDAVALRFFDGRSFADVGARLRLTENAARMRVDRALDKLHAALVRRGVSSTAAALGTVLANQAGVAAPAGVAASVTGAALAGAATGGGAGAWLAFLTMSKIKIGIVSALVVTVVATGVVELRANRDLRAELGALRTSDDEIARLERDNRQLNAALQQLSPNNSEVGEVARWRSRIEQLRARPEGVTDALMRTPVNAGRATAEAAAQTFYWSIVHRDLDGVAALIAFDDDTPENRAALMALVSEAVRAKYRTPERLCAAAFFDIERESPDPMVAMQLFRSWEDRPGQTRVDIWWRTASGQELGGGDRYQHRADGWGIRAFSLNDESIRKVLVARFDPATGERIQTRAEQAARKP